MKKELNNCARECLSFIDRGVSCFHVVEQIEEQLKSAGFTELKENERWNVIRGGSYYVKRNDSSLIAFRMPEGEWKGFHMVASHSDSPTFKLKENPEMTAENVYTRLNTEPYGGMIHSTWFDRSLSVAGRLVYAREDALKSVNVCIDEDLLVIPSLAIHMNREANKGMEMNPQTDLLPLFGNAKDKGKLREKLAKAAGLRPEDILGSDLYLYVREKGKIAGPDGQWLIAPRLDDLECVYASVKALLAAQPKAYCSMCAVFDNEEVGSHTRQGAASTFLKDVLDQIAEALGISQGQKIGWIADSFMISADNAHGLHPNHPEKADPVNRPVPNQGIVIKHHGGQRYTTDGISGGYMRMLCKQADVPWQDYNNRSDVPGGSTLGNISAGQVSVPTVDIGLAQFSMHSAVETAGSRDVEYLVRVLEAFYQK